MTSRRTFCATAASVVGGSLVAGKATAQSGTATVTGTIKSAVGASLGDSHMVLARDDPFEWFRADIDSNGEFRADVPVDTDYGLVYFDQEQGDSMNPEFDGVPVIYSLGDVSVGSGEKNIGSYTVPEGYVINVRIESPDGNPLQNVPLSFYTQSGEGTGPGSYTTNERGYVTHIDNERPGIELAESMRLSTHPRGDAPRVTLASIFANEDKELTAVLRKPDEYRSVVVREDVEGTVTPGIVEQESSGDDSTESSQVATASTDRNRMTTASTDRNRMTTASTDRNRMTTASGGDNASAQRGFLSNSGDDPPLLSNPANLTVGGFVLSVGGIVYQMVGGK